MQAGSVVVLDEGRWHDLRVGRETCGVDTVVMWVCLDEAGPVLAGTPSGISASSVNLNNLGNCAEVMNRSCGEHQQKGTSEGERIIAS